MKLTNLRYVFPPLLTVLIAIGIYFAQPGPIETWTKSRASLNSKPKTPVALVRQNAEQSVGQEKKLSEVFKRPLFSDTRRNPVLQEKVLPKEIASKEPEVEAIEEPRKTPPKLQFVGIIKRGIEFSALLRNDRTEEWHNLGDKISEWEIIAIRREKVTFKYKTQEFSIPITR